MTKLQWDQLGKKLFETGVDRGVLYPKSGPGVSWNGLISVEEAPTGGESNSLYFDGVKYFNESLLEEFEATITAYTYPEEFANIQGLGSTTRGLYYGEQAKTYFGLSYRSLIGNDTENISFGYKLHLIYDAITSASGRSRATLKESAEPDSMSWKITTLPQSVSGRKPTSHIVIDSTEVESEKLAAVERILYGTSTSTPRLPSISEIITIFDDWPRLEIQMNTLTGLSPLKYHGIADLKGDTLRGLYSIPEETRLLETTEPGLYTLEA